MDFPIRSGNAYVDAEEQGNAETDEEGERSWQLCREERTLVSAGHQHFPCIPRTDVEIIKTSIISVTYNTACCFSF